MRKIHSKELKLKIALEAIRGDLTIAQIVSKYQVAESLVHRWKKQLLDEGTSIFDPKSTSSKEPRHQAEDIEKLHAIIGKLKVENDFLENALLKSPSRSVVR